MLDTKLESRTFLLLLAVVTLAFGWLLLPFYGAVFWGTILAIIFAPVQRRLQVRLRDRKNLAALITLLICVTCCSSSSATVACSAGGSSRRCR